jgi:exonuclease SbcD
MRLLCCGDLHYRGSNPRARMDNFQAALDAKLWEVLDIADRRNVNATVIAGDIFDTPTPSYSVFAALARVLRASGGPILTVPGNHDIFGHNLTTLDRTAYGAMSKDWMDIIWDLCGEHMECPKERMLIRGSGYDADTDVKIDGYTVPQNVREYALPQDFDVFVLVAHGMALTSAPGFELRHTLLSAIATHPDAPDILIVGHEHIGFGAKWYPRGDGTEMLAINPGALCRLSANPAEIERQVQVCLLDIHGRDPGTGLLKVDVEMIPLKSAKPGHEVLSREHLVAAAEREERINKFLDLLASEGEVKFLETRQIVEELAKKEGLPADIVEEALRRIGRASEELGGQNAGR